MATNQGALQNWVQTKLTPWKEQAAAYVAAYNANMQRMKTHLPQLETIVSLLIEGRTRAAVLAWNTLGLHPQLSDIRVSPDGETLTLVPTSGDVVVKRLDDLLTELEKLKAAPAAQPAAGGALSATKPAQPAA